MLFFIFTASKAYRKYLSLLFLPFVPLMGSYTLLAKVHDP